jgi:hypothetical protein
MVSNEFKKANQFTFCRTALKSMTCSSSFPSFTILDSICQDLDSGSQISLSMPPPFSFEFQFKLIASTGTNRVLTNISTGYAHKVRYIVFNGIVISFIISYIQIFLVRHIYTGNINVTLLIYSQVLVVQNPVSLQNQFGLHSMGYSGKFPFTSKLV